MLTAMNHAHLVKLLATYKLGPNYHLLFPHADTNLRGFWDLVGIPYWNRKTFLWFLGQISGIASGLNTIHSSRTPVLSGSENGPQEGLLNVGRSEEIFGRHGDIKPENILWLNQIQVGEEGGTLQIADFGLGRFHRLDSRSRVNPQTISGSPSYSPPEIALNKPVSRAYDMWSLGCVFLEFVTWLLKGGLSNYKFASERGATAPDKVNDDTFYTVVTDKNGKFNAEVRNGVTSWIARLREHERCSPMVRDILNIVQQKLLVIDSECRIKSKELDLELARILRLAEANETYLLGNNVSPLDQDRGLKIPSEDDLQYATTSHHVSSYTSLEHSNIVVNGTHPVTLVQPVIQIEEYQKQ
jgi:serine/threonine protein kinase